MAGTSDLDVAYVARLARINLIEDEAKIFQKQLDDVLKYVEKLRQVDVTGIDRPRTRFRFLMYSATTRRADWFTANSVKQRAPAGKRPFCRPESGGMTGNELAALSIADLQSLLRRREVPREVIDALRERIEAVDPTSARIFRSTLNCDERGGALPTSIFLLRHSNCDQRHHQRDGSAVHVRVENFERISRAVRCHGD